MSDTDTPDDDWGFPEVVGSGVADPGAPASDALDTGVPDVEVPDVGVPDAGAPAGEQGLFDTGSDAWWRAQAATRAAPPAPEAAEPRVAEAPAAEPTPGPLETAWLQRSGPADTQPVSGLPVAEATSSLATPLLASVAASRVPGLEDPPPRPGRRAQAAQRQAGGRGRAVAGAVVALLGVLLAIGALRFLGTDHSRDGAGAVLALPTASTSTGVTSAPGAASTGLATPGQSVSPRTSTRPARVAPSTAPTPVPARTASAPATAAPVLPVTVLNNSRYSGLADRAAARFRAGGWPTPVVGNFRGRVQRTSVYWAPGQQASAVRFARQFGIARVAPRFTGLPGRGLTVVLTRDYVS